MAGVPSLMILEKQYQRWGSFVAPRFFVALPVRMPGTSERRSLGECLGEMGAPKSVNRSEYEGPGSGASVCDSNQRPAAVGSGRDRDDNRCTGRVAASVMSGCNPGQSQLVTAVAPDCLSPLAVSSRGP